MTLTNERYILQNEQMYTCYDRQQFEEYRTRDSNIPDRQQSSSSSDGLLSFSSKFKNIDAESVDNTFKYMFHKFKQGIYVKIKDGKLATFLPFSNYAYENEWHDKLKPPDNLASVYAYMDIHKKEYHPMNRWTCDNGVIAAIDITDLEACDLKLTEDFLLTVVNSKHISDVEFFINTYQTPLLRCDGTEPFYNIWGGDKLVSHAYNSYAPILSYSSSKWYDDIIIPSMQDWGRVTFQKNNKAISSNGAKYPKVDAQYYKYAKRYPKVVFNGSSSGAGNSVATFNKRLMALDIALDSGNSKFFKFDIVHWDDKLRNTEGDTCVRYVEHVNKPNVGTRSSMALQADYQMILNIESITASNVLSYQLSTKSCILIVKSEWNLWYTHLLKPGIHYVSIDANLGNLMSQIHWCLANPKKAETIANAGYEFYLKYLSRDYLIEYTAKLFNRLSIWEGSFDHLLLASPFRIAATINTVKKEYSDIVSRFSPNLFGSVIKYTDLARSIGKLDAIDVIFNHYLKSTHINLENKMIAGGFIMSPEVWEGFQFIVTSVNTENNSNPAYSTEIFKKVLRNRHIAIDNAHNIGRLVLNKLLSRIPNFIYTFNKIDDKYITEKVETITAKEFLKTASEKQVRSFIIQVLGSLIVAQNFYGFIHGKLDINSLRIQVLITNVVLSYQISQSHYITLNTDFIVFIGNVHKARAVANIAGNIHSTGNVWTPFDNRLDVVSFYNAYETIMEKVAPTVQATINFKDYVNIKTNRSLFGIITIFADVVSDATFTDEFSSTTMQNGHLLYALNAFSGKSHIESLVMSAGYIYKNKPARFNNTFFNHIIQHLIETKIKWLDTQILKLSLNASNPKFIEQWGKLKSAIFKGHPSNNNIRFPPEPFGFPVIDDISECDLDVTMLKTHNQASSMNLQTFVGDMIVVLNIIYFAYTEKLLSTQWAPMKMYTSKDGFDILTKLANCNDCLEHIRVCTNIAMSTNTDDKMLELYLEHGPYIKETV